MLDEVSDTSAVAAVTSIVEETCPTSNLKLYRTVTPEPSATSLIVCV
jgi:hypothetical protein